MKKYLNVERLDDNISITFYIEQDEVMEVGNRMEEINSNAYMNGYNWAAFLDSYLETNEPELLGDLETDPEAGMYSAYYPYSEENEGKANRIGEIICELIESPDELYKFLEEYGEDIAWD